MNPEGGEGLLGPRLVVEDVELKKIIESIVNIQRKITATLMLAMIVVIAIQIFGRMVFHCSTPWTEEISKYMLIWIAFIGGFGAVVKGEHMMVDILYILFSPRLKKYARVLNDVIASLFSGFLCYFGIGLCLNPVIQRSVTPAMQMPRVWLYSVLPVTMAFMCLYSIYDLVRAVRSLFEKGIRNDTVMPVSGGREC